MDKKNLSEMLEKYKAGSLSAEDFMARLVSQDYTEMKDICIDNMRGLRVGFPEVVYGAGKETDQVVAAVRKILERDSVVLVTRVEPVTAEEVMRSFPQAIWNKRGRTLRIGAASGSAGFVSVICAGTSDLPCAEEAAETAAAMGVVVNRIHDVGVAGLHRLLDRIEEIRKSDALVVVAGMEGALPSVVAGLVDVPVIAVPTSVGYGASFHGLAALLAMLNSCASGVSVVNIDNGFGAGYQAALIARRSRRGEKK
jgi:NCAIR mutase (PurE)-related protein